MMAKRCTECRKGEHENYDDNLDFVVVRDPDSGRLLGRWWLCEEHRTMYENDGCVVKTAGHYRRKGE